jgi:hypothetical protein
MTNTARRKAFEDNEPTLTGEEIVAAAENEQIVASLTVRPVLGMGQTDDIDYLSVKFALRDGSTSTLLLDQFSSEILHHAIQLVKNANWKADIMKSSGTAH